MQKQLSPPFTSGCLLPDDFLEALESARTRLARSLRNLDTASTGISPYNQRYLRDKLPGLDGLLYTYSQLIRLALEGLAVPPEDAVLVDYGGGSGLISQLALQCGVGTVVYNDIYEVSCADARCLAEHLGAPLEHQVCGDVGQVLDYLESHHLAPQAIVSYDVLEQIYDVEQHFATFRQRLPQPCRLVYILAANPAHPIYSRRLVKAQIRAEHEDREETWGHRKRDLLVGYLKARRQIIAACAGDLAPAQIDDLARATRGLRQDDIEACVRQFRQTGAIDYTPDHPTNTCDPYTGNWHEHLFDLDRLQDTVTGLGYTAHVLPGRYEPAGPLPKLLVKRLLNGAMQQFGRHAMFMSPHIVLWAELRPSSRPTTTISAGAPRQQPGR